MNTRELHPYTKFGLLFLISGFSVILDRPESLTVMTVFSLALFLLSRPERKILKIFFLFTLTTVWGVMVSQGLFYQMYPRTVVFCLIPPGEHFSGLCVIKEGFLYGLIQSLRLIATFSAGLYLVTSTPQETFFRAVSASFLPRGLVLMALSAIRFLPKVAEDLRLIRKALHLKGYRPLKRGLFYTVKAELSVLYPLLSRAVRQSRCLTDALLTRGFDPLSPSKRAFISPWPRHEKILTVFLLCLGLGVFILKLLFWLYLEGVFYGEALRPLYALVRDFL